MGSGKTPLETIPTRARCSAFAAEAVQPLGFVPPVVGVVCMGLRTAQWRRTSGRFGLPGVRGEQLVDGVELARDHHAVDGGRGADVGERIACDEREVSLGAGL